MKKLLRMIAVLALGVAAAPAGAQESFPTRPLRLIVPFPPGGNVDITARIIGPGLGEALGQTIVVDNRTGAGGIPGANLVAKEPANGGAGSARIGAWMRPGSGL